MRARARDGGRDPARVLGRRRRGLGAPARRRRGPRAGPAGRASSCASTAWSRRSGPGTRARASTATSSSSRRASSRPRSARPRRSLATRFEPEVFVPPLPGDPGAAGGRGRARRGAVLRRDGAAAAGRPVARRRAALPRTSTSSTAPAAPTSTSAGSRGVATKTTYATFLLYSLFDSGVLGAGGRQHEGARLQRQGRGPALARPAQHPAATIGRRPATAASACPVERVPERRPSSPRPAAATPTPVPDVASRDTGVTSFFWTLDEFCRDELLPFLFADAEDDRQQYTMVVHNVTARLRRGRLGGRRRGEHRGRGRAARSGSWSTWCRPGSWTRTAGPIRAGPDRPSARAPSTRSSAASTAPCPTSST